MADRKRSASWSAFGDTYFVIVGGKYAGLIHAHRCTLRDGRYKLYVGDFARVYLHQEHVTIEPEPGSGATIEELPGADVVQACVERAEKDLGRQLSEGERVDLVLDNFPGLRDSTVARELVISLEVKGQP